MNWAISSFIGLLPKEGWGWLSIAIGAAAYLVYIIKIIGDVDVQPNPLSWLAWTFATFMAALVQSIGGAGWGSGVTWFTSASCAAVLFAAIWKQRRRKRLLPGTEHPNSRWDWISLASSLAAAALFGLAQFLSWNQGTSWSAGLATLADVIAYKPTITKGWAYPRSDSAWAFFLNALKFAPAYAALDRKSAATALFPLTLIFFNCGVFMMLLWRRGAVKSLFSNVGERSQL